MAKRVIKTDRIREIIKNIAADFRFTNELGDFALLFYKYENEDTIRGADIDKMIEYVTTSLSELHNDPQWRAQYLAENPEQKEAKVLENMFIIEQEYKDLLEFLQ
jgi:hypothetical protein